MRHTPRAPDSRQIGKKTTVSQAAKTTVVSAERSPLLMWGASMALLLTATLWAYWSSLGIMSHKWAHDPQYSHGYLVPLFSIALLWMRRGMLDATKLKPSWWGLPVIFAAVALRLGGAYYFFEWFDFLSLIPMLLGICLLLGGWHALQWTWPAILFLVFMIPLPYTLEAALRGPLRQIGTLVSTYVMQTIGLPALAEGNVIVVNEARIGVVEACSGLRMLVIFFALSAAVALLSQRTLWERFLILASAIPIALISNITRIAVTGILHVTVGSKVADLVFHDLAGWLMIPLALGLLWAELALLDRLLIRETARPVVVGLGVPNPK
jgi:exosortase